VALVVLLRFASMPRSQVATSVTLALLTIVGSASAQRTASDTIRAIEVRRAPVFDSVEAQFWAYRLVNALHVVTRPYVVRRELLFRSGEPYDTARVNESERNLRALGIFRAVEIDSVRTDSGLVARVQTADGWTTEPTFNLSSSGKQAVVSVFIVERNLLGTRTAASIGFVSDPDRKSLLLGFDTPRMIANRVGVGALYINRSDGQAVSGSIRYPFFSLSSRAGGSLAAQAVDTRVLRYVDGRSRAADSLRRKFSLVRGEGAMALAASPRGYTRLGLTGQIRREDYGIEKGPLPVPRTVTGAAGPSFSVRRVRYIQTRNFEAMEQIEDVDLGFGARVSVLAAPSAWGYDRSGVGGTLDLAVGQPFRYGFLLLGASANALRTSEGVDSSSAIGSATLVVQGGHGFRHLFVGNAVAGYLKNPHPGGEFDLGLGYGVRAFPAHSFTGDREYLLNAEYRWIAIPSLLQVAGVGLAAFVDHAGAWYARCADSPTPTRCVTGSRRRSGTDAGFGLRLGSIRSAGTIVGRLDFAYRWANDRQPAGWVISLGRGFVFQRF
jgi:hypothetical protein